MLDRTASNFASSLSCFNLCTPLPSYTMTPAALPASAAGHVWQQQSASARRAARAEEQGVQRRHHVWRRPQPSSVRSTASAAGRNRALLYVRAWTVSEPPCFVGPSMTKLGVGFTLTAVQAYTSGTSLKKASTHRPRGTRAHYAVNYTQGSAV